MATEVASVCGTLSRVELTPYGPGLGLQRLPGVAVALSTYPGLGVNSSNFVAVVTSSASGLTASGTRVPVEQLNSGTHTVTVSLVQNPATKRYTLTLSIDGGLVVQAGVTVGPTALLAFTAGTGGLTDIHVVRNAALTATGW